MKYIKVYVFQPHVNFTGEYLFLQFCLFCLFYCSDSKQQSRLPSLKKGKKK